jgi:hypothetical protein
MTDVLPADEGANPQGVVLHADWWGLTKQKMAAGGKCKRQQFERSVTEQVSHTRNIVA